MPHSQAEQSHSSIFYVHQQKPHPIHWKDSCNLYWINGGIYWMRHSRRVSSVAWIFCAKKSFDRIWQIMISNLIYLCNHLAAENIRNTNVIVPIKNGCRASFSSQRIPMSGLNKSHVNIDVGSKRFTKSLMKNSIYYVIVASPVCGSSGYWNVRTPV